MKNLECDLNSLTTEQVNERSRDIDKLSTFDMVSLIHKEDLFIYQAIDNVLDTLSEVIDEIFIRMRKGGRLIYFGAGTSGRLGVLDASECPPTYGVSKDLIQGRIAGGYKAITEAVEGAEDNKDLAIKDVSDLKISSIDSIIGIAASGRTPYVYEALKQSKEIGALTVSLVSVENSILSEVSDYDLAVLTGPEVITGSTRMKCGTAHKMILNMISTSLMIKLGKTDGNLMVDLKVKNKKLEERAKRIVMQRTSCSESRAEDLLKETNFNIKLAIVIERFSVDYSEAIKMLERAEGVLSKVENTLSVEKV